MSLVVVDTWKGKSMPDISMCANKDCQIRMECYRYTAEPHPFRQSWGNFEYDNGCDHYLDNKWCLKERWNELAKGEAK